MGPAWQAHWRSTQIRRWDVWEGHCSRGIRCTKGLGKQSGQALKMLWLLEIRERQEQMIPRRAGEARRHIHPEMDTALAGGLQQSRAGAW